MHSSCVQCLNDDSEMRIFQVKVYMHELLIRVPVFTVMKNADNIPAMMLDFVQKLTYFPIFFYLDRNYWFIAIGQL
jgi:hypothetical protein